MKPRIRATRLLGLLILVAMITAAIPSTAQAAHGLECAEQPVKSVGIQFLGLTHYRPDSREDGQPATNWLGPFQVTGRIDPAFDVASVVLLYNMGGDAWSTTAMTVDGLDVTGRIPRQSDFIGTRMLHFYLRAYNDQGQQIYPCVELPYACTPYSGGDPYNIQIVRPAPFAGNWVREHPEGKDPMLQITTTSVSPSTGDAIVHYYVHYVGYKGNVLGPPAQTDLKEPFLLKLKDFDQYYEYDTETGLLYAYGTLDNHSYVRRGGRP